MRFCVVAGKKSGQGAVVLLEDLLVDGGLFEIFDCLGILRILRVESCSHVKQGLQDRSRVFLKTFRRMIGSNEFIERRLARLVAGVHIYTGFTSVRIMSASILMKL